MTEERIIEILLEALRAELEAPGYLIHEGDDGIQVDGWIDLRAIARALQRAAVVREIGDAP